MVIISLFLERILKIEEINAKGRNLFLIGDEVGVTLFEVEGSDEILNLKIIWRSEFEGKVISLAILNKQNMFFYVTEDGNANLKKIQTKNEEEEIGDHLKFGIGKVWGSLGKNLVALGETGGIFLLDEDFKFRINFISFN